MSTYMEKLKDTLYGKEGLGVSNFKLFPGTNREITSEEIAEEILKSLDGLMTDAQNNPDRLSEI